MRKLWLGLLFLVLPIFSLAENLPQPQGRVNDFANVISSDYREKLNALIQELEEKTSSEIAVVTVSSIAPYDEIEYARLIFDNWKPGKKGKDNGVLVLLAVKERRWRIETGYGVEGILPDGLCGEIGRNYMVPYFKDGNYAAGLYYGVTKIAKVIAGNTPLDKVASLPERTVSKSSDPFAGLFMMIFALGFFTLWNIPWPIFIGLPFTLIFALSFAAGSPFAGILVITGYLIAMFIRYRIWADMPPSSRKSFLYVLIFGLATLPGQRTGRFGGGGFSGGGFGGGGFGGGGGGG
ncbi:MAG: TPM domain-containing protein, partial [Candidatus Omnitrophica bacterium]|nr:TPM domain-containing protein [Candidatus Omnitrophota bacterium]